MLIGWMIFVHVTAAFVFFSAHGVSIGVALRLRSERVPERVRTLLDFSDASRMTADIGFLVLLATGIAAAVMAHLWGKGWVWTSLGLFLLLTVIVGVGMTPYFNRLRRAAGSPYREHGTLQPGREQVAFREAEAMIAPGHLTMMTVIGVVVSAAILYLMMFKPF